MTKKRIIGHNNSLPWHIPEDLKNFKNTTNGQTVIMGRNTWESIPEKFRPLPNRNNIIISKALLPPPGAVVCGSFEEGLEKAASLGKEIFIIGGASIYQQALPIAHKMHLSYVKKEYEGNIFFPEFNQEDWEVTEKKDFAEFELVTYTKKFN